MKSRVLVQFIQKLTDRPGVQCLGRSQVSSFSHAVAPLCSQTECFTKTVPTFRRKRHSINNGLWAQMTNESVTDMQVRLCGQKKRMT
jgi:hypothetical protein